MDDLSDYGMELQSNALRFLRIRQKEENYKLKSCAKTTSKVTFLLLLIILPLVGLWLMGTFCAFASWFMGDSSKSKPKAVLPNSFY